MSSANIRLQNRERKRFCSVQLVTVVECRKPVVGSMRGQVSGNASGGPGFDTCYGRLFLFKPSIQITSHVLEKEYVHVRCIHAHVQACQ